MIRTRGASVRPEPVSSVGRVDALVVDERSEAFPLDLLDADAAVRRHGEPHRRARRRSLYDGSPRSGRAASRARRRDAATPVACVVRVPSRTGRPHSRRVCRGAARRGPSRAEQGLGRGAVRCGSRRARFGCAPRCGGTSLATRASVPRARRVPTASRRVRARLRMRRGAWSRSISSSRRSVTISRACRAPSGDSGDSPARGDRVRPHMVRLAWTSMAVRMFREARRLTGRSLEQAMAGA